MADVLVGVWGDDVCGSIHQVCAGVCALLLCVETWVVFGAGTPEYRFGDEAVP